MAEQEKDYWCRFSDITNSQTFFIAISYQSMVLVLFVFTIYRLIKLIKLQINIDTIIIYSLILLWQVIFLSLQGLSIAEYVLIKDLVSENIPYERYPHYIKQTFPRIIVAIDELAGPIILTILIVVPYFWVKSIKYFMEKIDEPIENPFFRNLDKIIAIYLTITRIGYVSIHISFYFLGQYQITVVYRWLRLFICIDSIFTTFIIYFGGRTFISNFIRLAIVNEKKDSRQITLKFCILIIVCLCRLAVNFTFFFSAMFSPIFQLDWVDCLTQNSVKQTIMFSSMFLTHILPALIVLWLYKGADSALESKVQQSMISSSSATQKDSFLY